MKVEIDPQTQIVAPRYPEHEKQHAIMPKAEAIGEFFDWLKNTRKILRFQGFQIKPLLAEYFQIDLAKIAEEKDAMLRGMREAQGKDIRSGTPGPGPRPTPGLPAPKVAPAASTAAHVRSK